MLDASHYGYWDCTQGKGRQGEVPKGVLECRPVFGQQSIQNIEVGNSMQVYTHAESSGHGEPAKVQGEDQH
jgi:hypothetical protein